MDIYRPDDVLPQITTPPLAPLCPRFQPSPSPPPPDSGQLPGRSSHSGVGGCDGLSKSNHTHFLYTGCDDLRKSENRVDPKDIQSKSFLYTGCIPGEPSPAPPHNVGLRGGKFGDRATEPPSAQDPEHASLDRSSTFSTLPAGNLGSSYIIIPSTSCFTLPSSPATSTPIANHTALDGTTDPESGPDLYPCTFEGCEVAPFKTKYLLASHMTVHSSVRTFHCSVKGCPEGSTGKGFKRKYELERHSLTHGSSKHACRFCSRRYPRPDNLRRHMRTQHPDENKDDLQNPEVLAQQLDGSKRRKKGQRLPS